MKTRLSLYHTKQLFRKFKPFFTKNNKDHNFCHSKQFYSLPQSNVVMTYLLKQVIVPLNIRLFHD